MSERSVTLYCTEGGSDKVYQIHLRRATSAGGGWVVDRANGPRGKTLRPGTETPQPVELEVAVEIFERLLRSKLKKGYFEGEGGRAYASAEFAGLASGHRQQLPTAIPSARAVQLLKSPGWALQEKANGERRTLRIDPSGDVRGINKLGLYTSIPAHWIPAFAGVALDGGALFDGEQVGDDYYVFDVLELHGRDLRHRPFGFRIGQITRVVDVHAETLGFVKPLLPIVDPRAKIAEAAAIAARAGEGYVLKRLDAPYEAGRSDAALKFKFTESSTCLVRSLNRQRSVALALIDAAGEWVSVGNVTIPANHEMPSEGDLVEVEYLYYNPRGAFEQPVYLGRRHDVAQAECHFGQVMRLKPGAVMPIDLWREDEEAGQEDSDAMRC